MNIQRFRERNLSQMIEGNKVRPNRSPKTEQRPQGPRQELVWQGEFEASGAARTSRMGLSADVGAQRFKTDTRGGITCAANDLGYNPGHHGEAQSKEKGPQVFQSQDTQTHKHWRQVAQRG